MYPQKNKIQRLITLYFFSVVIFYALGKYYNYIYALSDDFLYKIQTAFIVTIPRYIIFFGTPYIVYKSLVCPSCKRHSFWFAQKVVFYYGFNMSKQHKKKLPPQCPKCGRAYGDYHPEATRME